MIRVDPWAYVAGALLALVLPLDWLLAALCAAAFHEVCHAVAIHALGGRILGMRIGIGGAAIETELPSRRRELLCALAGPGGSLLLIGTCRLLPKVAICAGIQGIFNLLPIFPLDGGRALRCGLEMLWPEKAEKIGNRVEFAAFSLLAILLAAGTLALSLGSGPMLIALLLILKAIFRKKPCKQYQIGVQ